MMKEVKGLIQIKNIIVVLLNWGVLNGQVDTAGNNYLDLNNIGTGKGYYITNGYAVPITWSKTSRADKTKYMYKEGTIIDGKDVGGQEISVSDGRTWIEVQTTKQKTIIE